MKNVFFFRDKDHFKGWPTFFMSIFSIGVLTAVIGDVAAHFGCYSHIKDSITAITIVALGTSVPGKWNF
jgi:solute carrier family 8 (sodium/calcium exchanger)